MTGPSSAAGLRLHVVSLPWTHTTSEFLWCAYTQKVVRFAGMMTDRGHHVTVYSGRENEARCAEHVEVITPEEQAGILGTTDAPWDPQHPAWRAMNLRAAIEIGKRATPDDLVLLISGTQKPLADNLPPGVEAVEFGIGYAGPFARFRIFESWAWLHTVMGAKLGADWDLDTDRRWFDTVIPNYYDLADFEVGDPSGGRPYFAFLGRGIIRKGPQIAADVCEHLGEHLELAGQDLGGFPDYGTRVGPVDAAVRRTLLAGATALFVPTTYCGPFEGVAAEALLSGCPVITTDAGAFTETVRPGDGWRCSTMSEFVDAARAAITERDWIRSDGLEVRRQRRQRAVDRFGFDAVAPQFEAYFDRLACLWREGWTELERPSG